jgi:hypothetical protein
VTDDQCSTGSGLNVINESIAEEQQRETADRKAGHRLTQSYCDSFKDGSIPNTARQTCNGQRNRRARHASLHRLLPGSTLVLKHVERHLRTEGREQLCIDVELSLAPAKLRSTPRIQEIEQMRGKYAIVGTENLNTGVVVMKSAQDGT